MRKKLNQGLQNRSRQARYQEKKKSNETRKNNPKERIIPKLRFICIFTFNYGHVTSFRNYRSKSRQESAVVGIG